MTHGSQLFKMMSMRAFLLRSAVVIMLAAMLGGHVTELFDHWDQTLRTGQDGDYAIVLIAACAGAAFVTAASVRFLRRLLRIFAESAPCIFLFAAVKTPAPEAFAFDLSPPPDITPIRI